MAQGTIELTELQRMNLAAFADHTVTCAKCCRKFTTGPKSRPCVRGIMFAAMAGDILLEHGIGTADRRRTGIAK